MSTDALDREANRQYWAHMVKQTEWAASHPCSQYPETSIPTFLYGDDVKYNRQEKLTCVYLGFILADKKGLAMRTHFPILIVREACALLKTENRNPTNVISNSNEPQNPVKVFSLGFKTLQAFMKPALWHGTVFSICCKLHRTP